MSEGNEEVPATLFSNDTWLSLTGLLNPTEYFFTVDHQRVWRHHLAWSKVDGNQLKSLTVQQFSTNMVFMSLLLSSELGVLFNSSTPATEMRDQMKSGNYGSLLFWTGVIIVWAVAITGVALMATFTAWRMVSVISDENTHCVLRSSIGLFVTQFPSRLVVMSLYSFAAWFTMFMVQMLAFPFNLIILCLLMAIFFQMIMIYSAFGRIIIHTGAMGTKRVLDPEFERSLLSSGLHASLLIKATARAKRRVTADTQYQSREQNRNSELSSASRQKSNQENKNVNETVTTTSIDMPDDEFADRKPFHTMPRSNAPAITPTNSTKGGKEVSPDKEDSDSTPSPATATRKLLKGGKRYFKRQRGVRFNQEWVNENRVRSTYDAPPPARLERVSGESSRDEETSNHEAFDSSVAMPRASFLNKRFSLKGLRKLAKVVSEDDNDVEESSSLRVETKSNSKTWYGALPSRENNAAQAVSLHVIGGEDVSQQSLMCHMTESSSDDERGRPRRGASNVPSWKSSARP